MIWIIWIEALSLKSLFEPFRYHMYVITLVPIFIIGPALAVGVYLMRHKIRHCRTYLCCGTSKNPDKDDMRIEEANGEFSHEMHFNLESENPRSRKISMNSSHVYSSDPTATPSGLNGVDPNDPVRQLVCKTCTSILPSWRYLKAFENALSFRITIVTKISNTLASGL